MNHGKHVYTALVLAACAGAANAAPPPAGDKGDGSKMICRTVQEIGSRLSSKRICLTRDQWREQKASQRQDLEGAQRIRTGPDPADPTPM
jgi:hypothetical protein